VSVGCRRIRCPAACFKEGFCRWRLPTNAFCSRYRAKSLSATSSSASSPSFCDGVAQQIAGVARTGIEIAVVTGARQYLPRHGRCRQWWRPRDCRYDGYAGYGDQRAGAGRCSRPMGVKAKVFSAPTMPSVADTFTARAAKAGAEDGYVVVLRRRHGNPFFTTDTAAASRRIELNATCCSRAPRSTASIQKIPRRIRMRTAMTRSVMTTSSGQNFRVMDTAAFALARDNNLPIIVYSLDDKEGLVLAGRSQHPCWRAGPAQFDCTRRL
jgi:uridylate kinase